MARANPRGAGALLIAALSAAAAGCGSSTPVVEGPRPALFRPVPLPEPKPDRAPLGKLYRDDVVRLVDAGFPEFLQKVEVEADVRDGRFMGWTLLALYPQDFWEGVDLRPGDVVTRINGLPIERETEAYDAFQALKTAPNLVVSFVREGEVRQLSFEIIPRSAPAAPGALPQSPAAPPASPAAPARPGTDVGAASGARFAGAR